MGDDLDSAIVLLSATSAACLFLESEKAEEEKRKRRQNRRRWVKEWRLTRERAGNYQALIKELKGSDTNDYKNFLRMDELCFNRLLSYIIKDIEKQDTYLRAAIPASERLAVTLRFLATGENYKNLDFNTKLSSSFLQKNIINVCEAIYRNMKAEFLKFPNQKEEWMAIADNFQTRWQFPLCIGALDGKHISFKPAKTNAAMFYNYKGFHSIVLLAMADADAKFIFVDVGCNGRISDGGVLSRSDLMAVLNNADYFPPNKLIGNGRLLPYVIVADEAFPLHDRIMKPFPFNSTEDWKQTFNKRLSRARQNVERSFGILANRFQVLQNTINLRENKTTTIVQCCCVLHNFLVTNSEWYMQYIDNCEPEDRNNLQNPSAQISNISNKNPVTIRKQFAEFFSNEGRMN